MHGLKHIADDGIIWHSVSDELKKFSIEKNSEIETNIDLNQLSVMGMGEVNDRVILFCADYESSAISVFDTAAEKFIGDFPDSEELTRDGKDQEIEMKVVVQNNMALVTDSEKANASENSKHYN